MTKAQLRKNYLRARKSLTKIEVEGLSRNIFEHFIQNFQILPHQKVHLFLSIEKFNEVETSAFIHYFLRNSVRVFVPKIIGERMISVEIFPESQYERNSLGIWEPMAGEDSKEKDFDFIITPLLYCDFYGNRVGYGKGFYDRFFAENGLKSAKIGLNFFLPQEIIEDVEEQDVPLDYLVTPEGMLSFGALMSKFTK